MDWNGAYSVQARDMYTLLENLSPLGNGALGPREQR